MSSAYLNYVKKPKSLAMQIGFKKLVHVDVEIQNRRTWRHKPITIRYKEASVIRSHKRIKKAKFI